MVRAGKISLGIRNSRIGCRIDSDERDAGQVATFGQHSDSAHDPRPPCYLLVLPQFSVKLIPTARGVSHMQARVRRDAEQSSEQLALKAVHDRHDEHKYRHAKHEPHQRDARDERSEASGRGRVSRGD